jgi:cell division protein FtsX
VLRETWRAVTRNLGSFLMATAVQAVCLSLLAVFAVVALNLPTVVNATRKQIEIHVFLAPGTDAADLQSRIRHISGIRATRYVSSDDALAELTAELGDDASLVEALETNPLPASIRATLAPGAASPQRLAAIERKIALLPGVTEAWSGSEDIARLDRLLRVAIGITIGILILVSLSVAFVVFQAVETSILTRAREIEIMELVGATRAMVRAPFILEGTFQGLLGGAVALLLVTILWLTVASVFPQPVFPLNGVALLSLGLGGLLGFLGSTTALNRLHK